MRGTHLIAHWTRLQQVVTTSSAEAELVAACCAMTALISVEIISADLCQPWKGQMKVDARAC